jgi:hypothetical protein
LSYVLTQEAAKKLNTDIYQDKDQSLLYLCQIEWQLHDALLLQQEV